MYFSIEKDQAILGLTSQRQILGIGDQGVSSSAVFYVLYLHIET